jgi:putative ABC transport system permease protein
MSGVETATGVFVATANLGSKHPFFIEVGLRPRDQADFGVTVVRGRSYHASGDGEMMLGWRAAQEFGVDVGDAFQVEERRYRVVGVFSTKNPFGDQAGMFSLTDLQAWHRQPETLTLAFVRAKPGVSIDGLRNRIDDALPGLATARSQSDYGRVDRNLVLISAANVGGSVLALFIGATGVMNTTLLSFFERLHEFGVLRAVGWSRRRLVALVLGEALLVTVAGAAVGLAVGVVAVQGLTHVGDLVGVLQPDFPAEIFGRALLFAFGMALLGALYPVMRAVRLTPLSAMQHE